MRVRQPARSGSITARVLARIVDHVAARGHDANALCRSAGLHLALLCQPDARLPYAVAERLSERAIELTRDPNLGLHVAADVQDPRRFDAGLLLLAASPNVRVALERMVRYQRYWGDGERSRLMAVEDSLVVRYVLPEAGAVTQRHNDECAVAELILGLRWLAFSPVVASVVRFRHAAPRDRSEHDRLFASPIDFAAPHTEAVFDQRTLATPLPHANDFYAEVFIQQVERAIAALPRERDVVEEARAVVRAALAGGACTLASTARVLGLTARTLQRRFASDGTSFDHLVEAVRQEQALRYLDQELSVAEIAALLGYGETSAFHRAFKRWNGTTPERARAIRHAGR